MIMWQGDKSNPVPNIGTAKGEISQHIAEESRVLSEKETDINRAHQIRRDNDKQKDNTVKLVDVDNAIIKQLEKFQLMVTDDANQIKVPVFYASPEKWKTIQYDGAMRDYNGKLILPAIVFQRTTSEKDAQMMMFNRYLNYPVIRKFSPKNRYTRFNILIGQNVPVNEVYDIVMPDHMVFTYQFIIWTEYVEQMNTLVEKINFETEDYWGDIRGLRFRTKIQSFSHTIDLQVDQDRMVKTEFDLIVNGYLLPDTINKFQGTKDTTQKWLTPKKIVLGTETVEKENEIFINGKRAWSKWQNPNYPNLPIVVPVVPPPVTFKKLPEPTTQQPLSSSVSP